jgi:hypothetical protein
MVLIGLGLSFVLGAVVCYFVLVNNPKFLVSKEKRDEMIEKLKDVVK